MANTASAGPPSSCIRRRSVATPSPPLPPPTAAITTTKPADLARTRPRQNSNNNNNHHHHHYHPAPNGHHHPAPASSAPVVAVSFLQPRIAVALGIPRFWHPFLSVCRLVSIAPALWLGLRFALRFLIGDFLRNDRDVLLLLGLDFSDWQVSVDQRLRLTETALSIIWCGASAYLAFVFTDCLMSRWLLNYTPHATVVRLVTLVGIFSYVSSWTVHLLGGADDPSLLLPAWVAIATTLTACYHFTQRKINIRKETSASISVFSIASFISMVALLVHQHASKLDHPTVPLVHLARRAAEIGGRVVVYVLDVQRELREKDGI